MAVTVTVSNVADYLFSLGYSCDATIVESLIERANSKDSCLDSNNYPDYDVRLLKTYLVAIGCVSSGARRVKSERALSGDSRAFESEGYDQAQIVANIRQLDPMGCLTSLIPVTKGAYLRVVGGLK